MRKLVTFATFLFYAYFANAFLSVLSIETEKVSDGICSFKINGVGGVFSSFEAPCEMSFEVKTFGHNEFMEVEITKGQLPDDFCGNTHNVYVTDEVLLLSGFDTGQSSHGCSFLKPSESGFGSFVIGKIKTSKVEFDTEGKLKIRSEPSSSKVDFDIDGRVLKVDFDVDGKVLKVDFDVDGEILEVRSDSTVYSQDESSALFIPVDDLRGLKISPEKLGLAIKDRFEFDTVSRVYNISFSQNESLFDYIKYTSVVIDPFDISFSYTNTMDTYHYRCKIGRVKHEAIDGLFYIKDAQFILGIIDCNNTEFSLFPQSGYIIEMRDIVSDQTQFEFLKTSLN